MNVLEEADTLINGERAKTYGSPTPLYERTAGMWAAYLGAPVTAANVIDMMILLKVARAQPGYHRDSFVDTAGYAAIAERLHHEAAAEQDTEQDTPATVPEPRVWKTYTDVPKGEGVIVTDYNGVEFTRDFGEEGSGYILYPVSGPYVHPMLPVTEVLG